MNKHTLRSLFDDALYQVLDNMVFRILVVLVLVFVLPTFLVGFREKEIVVLFTWHFEYGDFLSRIGRSMGDDTQKAVISVAQSLFVDIFAGSFGIFFCVVATSFFMPRMLEKGAADTVFSKPVSRIALLLSRYIAGLLFVGILSAILVGGQCLGFQLVSGYSDVGFLWSILTLVWLFMMLHAVSLLAGVYTRSSIAAVMIVIVFYAICGGVHGSWGLSEGWREDHERKVESIVKRGGDASGEEIGTGVRWTLGALDIAHYVLPKTSDADLIAKMFRRQLEGRNNELVDDDTHLRVAHAPAGYLRELRSSFNKDGLLWIARHPAQGAEARWTFRKEAYGDVGSRSTVIKALRKSLEANPDCSEIKSERGDLDRYPFDRIEWREKRGEESRARRRWILQSSEWIVTLDYDAELQWSETTAEQDSASEFFAGLSIRDDDSAGGMQVDPHTREFGWSAPWKNSAWFSILSTAGFIVAMLGIAWSKMARVDF